MTSVEHKLYIADQARRAKAQHERRRLAIDKNIDNERSMERREQEDLKRTETRQLSPPWSRC